jgi:hypothetical protein
VYETHIYLIARINQEGGPGLGLSWLGSNGGLELGGRLNVDFLRAQRMTTFQFLTVYVVALTSGSISFAAGQVSASC